MDKTINKAKELLVKQSKEIDYFNQLFKKCPTINNLLTFLTIHKDKYTEQEKYLLQNEKIFDIHNYLIALLEHQLLI